MTKFIIPIDISTIRKNPLKPHEPYKYYHTYPPEYIKNESGEIISIKYDCFPLYLPGGNPRYLYDYDRLVLVQCNDCENYFGWNDLEYAEEINLCEDNFYSDSVCPHCGIWNCCELEFEKLDLNLAKSICGE